MDNVMDLTIIQNGNVCLSAEASAKLAEIEKLIKELKAQEDEIKQTILSAMEERGIIKFDTDDVLVSYIAPTSREKFDSKKFREEHPDLYDEYIDFAPVKSSIRIKLK